MAGYALAAAIPVVSNDLSAEKRFSDRGLRNLGVGAVLTVPLRQDKQPLGTLGIYCRQPRQFSADDAQFVETIGHILTASIAQARTDEALAEERSFTAALLETVASLVIVLDMDAKIVDINPSCQRASGFAVEEVKGRIFVSVFATPEDLYLYHGTFQKAARDQAPCKFEAPC